MNSVGKVISLWAVEQLTAQFRERWKYTTGEQEHLWMSKIISGDLENTYSEEQSFWCNKLVGSLWKGYNCEEGQSTWEMQLNIIINQ